MSLGREAPDLIALRLKKKVLTMFFATGLTINRARYRLSMRKAVSKSTWAPSTMAASAASGAG